VPDPMCGDGTGIDNNQALESNYYAMMKK